MRTQVHEFQCCLVQVRLERAISCRKRGRHKEAVRLCELALVRAESLEGRNSPLAGLVLLQLADLYEEQGRDNEAEALWERIRQIVVTSRQAIR